MGAIFSCLRDGEMVRGDPVEHSMRSGVGTALRPAPPGACEASASIISSSQRPHCSASAHHESTHTPAGVWDAQTGAFSSELRLALTELDKPLLEVLEIGHIRLLRSEWLLKQKDSFILPRRQELEELEKLGQSPLLSCEEAVALIRRGDRSVGALTYRWLTAKHPVSPQPPSPCPSPRILPILVDASR